MFGARSFVGARPGVISLPSYVKRLHWSMRQFAATSETHQHLSVWERRLLFRTACFVFMSAAVGLGQSANDEDRDVSFKKLVPNILEDQKHIWTFPVRLGEGHN